MFLCEKIEVEFDVRKGEPVSFIWRNQKFVIKKVLASWQDFGFSSGAPKKKTWRLRKHRNYYKIETDTDEIFEIYLDRTGSKREWIISKKINC